jgi:hypothetical protein
MYSGVQYAFLKNQVRVRVLVAMCPPPGRAATLWVWVQVLLTQGSIRLGHLLTQGSIRLGHLLTQGSIIAYTNGLGICSRRVPARFPMPACPGPYHHPCRPGTCICKSHAH